MTLDGIVSLLGAIATLITAITGLAGVIFIGIRGSRRERHGAAKAVLEHITPPDPKDIAEELTGGEDD